MVAEYPWSDPPWGKLTPALAQSSVTCSVITLASRIGRRRMRRVGGIDAPPMVPQHRQAVPRSSRVSHHLGSIVEIESAHARVATPILLCTESPRIGVT